MSNQLSRITMDPAVCHGKPCVRGLRYPVETLLELFSSGMTAEPDQTRPAGGSMRFVSRRPLAAADGWLVRRRRCDAVHTLDLPEGNRTTDDQLIVFADVESRAIVTKDADFVNSHLLDGKPQRLLLISTGNISNNDLEALIVPFLPDIARKFHTACFLEFGLSGLVIRG